MTCRVSAEHEMNHQSLSLRQHGEECDVVFPGFFLYFLLLIHFLGFHVEVKEDRFYRYSRGTNTSILMYIFQ